MEDYGNAGRGVKKSIAREKKRHKQRTNQIGVRYATLRAGQSLINKLAKASVPKPTKSGKAASSKSRKPQAIDPA